MPEFTVASVTQRRLEIEQRIEQLQPEAPVKIIAVTKGHDRLAVEVAMAAGFADVGENYAQEAVAKQAAFIPGTSIPGTSIPGASMRQPVWHFIGQLQRNKVKLVAPFIKVWHTVDSVALADEIAKRAAGASVFVQVNLTDDGGRGGCAWSELDRVVDGARAGGLDVLGLMGVAPAGPPDTARAAFQALARAAKSRDLSELSMGMSGDYEVAIQEGATMIRLGSTLFGVRRLPGAEPR